MQNSSADNLPSLSATSPTNDTTSLSSIDTKLLNGCHDGTKPFVNPGSVPKIQRKSIMTKTHDAAVKTAKQEIRARVREDWTWPLPSTKPLSEILEGLEEAQDWRERDSDSSYCPPSPVLESDPYRFDNPNSLAYPALSRKRKRREALKQEMSWNEGLRTFVERRDAWSGARARPRSPPTETTRSHKRNTSGTSQDSTSYLPTPPPPTSIKPDYSRPDSPPTVLPIAPPLLPPTNPIRAAISSATYPSIYSKIILQGLAPTIPINLKDVVNALVQGWKKDGDWPPKTEAEKSGGGGGEGKGRTDGGVVVGRKAVRRSVGRVKRVLGLGHGIDGAGRGEGRLEH